MIVEDQSQVISFLSRSATWGLSTPVAREETHISEIFLTDDRAYKLKRAVKLPYVDFSTPALRLQYCEREVDLNSRTAPDLYVGARRITRTPDGGLELDGDGDLVDAVVEMVRFREDDILDGMAHDGRLTAGAMRDLSDAIAAFHEHAEKVTDRSGASLMEGVLSINEAGFATSTVFPDDEVDRLCKAFREAHGRLAERLDRRSDDGCIRIGHGDLHLRNICMFEGRPTLFDCIEFNDEIATVDVLYDLAFLLMDLWHRDMRGFANLVANRYLDRTGHEEGYRLLPFFMAVRAAVRAHVTATQADEAEEEDQRVIDRAWEYFRLAGELLQPAPPRLVATGGLSGSGKSTLAERLAPGIGAAPGARILESDRTRKALYGKAPEERLPDSAYAPEVSARVYAQMAERARTLIEDGSCVIAEAVHGDPERRRAIAEAARQAGVPFTGIWLDAPAEVLRRRIIERPATASDADAAVLESQLAGIAPAQDWHRVDVGGTIEETLTRIRQVLPQEG